MVLFGAGLIALLNLLERRAVRRAARNYESRINWEYQRLHCRDARTFESNETAFTFACRCRSVTQPWTELRGLAENAQLFVFLTHGPAEILPKSAFQTEAERTELRRACSEIVDRDRSIAVPSIDYYPSVAEYRDARVLNFVKAGGWKPFVRVYAVISVCAVLLSAIWRNPAPMILGFVLSGAVTVKALRAQGRNAWYVGPRSIAFDENGFYIKDSSSTVRTQWEGFLGFVESKRLFLLFYSPQRYRIIPLRALGPKLQEFESLLRAKLQPYDYRQPMQVRTELSQN